MQNEKKTILRVDNLALRLLETSTDIKYGSFTVEENDFVIIKGSNGSGKSTFLKIFSPSRSLGYCAHLRGSMYYEVGELRGRDIFSAGYDRARLLRSVVNITQEERFSTFASARSAILQPALVAIREDASLAAKEKKTLEGRASDLADYYFREVLTKYGTFPCSARAFRLKPATAFSGGQQKMLNLLGGLIKAEVLGSRLILMDEPLNNLDGKNKAIFREVMRDMRARNPIAVVAITHCQIFDGINKVITIDANAAAHENLVSCSTTAPDCHNECLEDICLKTRGARDI